MKLIIELGKPKEVHRRIMEKELQMNMIKKDMYCHRKDRKLLMI